MSTENLSLAWTGDFDSLKKFSNEVLNLDGEWTQPGGDKKLFTFGNSSIVWRKTKGLLLFKGEQSMAVKTKICEAMLQESFNPPSQTHSGISPGDCMDEIESLRSGQLLNGEAIQLLANSVSQISSIIAELQAKAKPSTDDLSEKNTEKSLEEKIEQFEYAKSTNTNTDNPIVIEQSEQLMASNNANSDEYTPLIEKNTLEKTLEINDNQEGISTLNGLIDDVSDNNIKTSYAKAAKSHLDLRNPSKTPTKSAKDKLSLATNAKENTPNSEGLIHSDVPDGFIGVERKRNKYKKFFLSGIADGVKESQIYSYLIERNITPTMVSTFQSKRKGTMSAKIHIPLTTSSVVLEKNFWPEFVYCKPWQQKIDKKQNTLQKNKETLVGSYITLV
jgi:hypothetical protein